jgi:hypothetical protein
MSSLPEIPVTNKKLNKSDIEKLNKLSSILLEKYTNIRGGAGQKKKSTNRTRKASKRR